jgi:ABC-type microcin C transport system permease subunit YejE
MSTTLRTCFQQPLRPEGSPGIIWRRFRRHKLAMFSLGVMIVIFTASLFARQIPRSSRTI